MNHHSRKHGELSADGQTSEFDTTYPALCCSTYDNFNPRRVSPIASARRLMVALFRCVSQWAIAPLFALFEKFLIYGFFTCLFVQFFDEAFAHIVNLHSHVASGIFDGGLIVDVMLDADKHLLGHIEQVANGVSLGIIPVLLISEVLYVAIFIMVNLPNSVYTLFIAGVFLKFVQVIHCRLLATDLSSVINRGLGYPYTKGQHDHCNQLQCIGGAKLHLESFVYFSEHHQSPSRLCSESCGDVTDRSTQSSMMRANIGCHLDDIITHDNTKQAQFDNREQVGVQFGLRASHPIKAATKTVILGFFVPSYQLNTDRGAAVNKIPFEEKPPVVTFSDVNAPVATAANFTELKGASL